MTNWTIARGDDGVPAHRRVHAFTGMTLLMSTEELLAVLEDGAATIAAPAAEPKPERRLRIAPPPAADEQQETPPPPAAPPARTIWAPTPPPLPRPSLRSRLQCALHGHDPRPHRPLPHDAVSYRCLRCGRAMPAPQLRPR